MLATKQANHERFSSTHPKSNIPIFFSNNSEKYLISIKNLRVTIIRNQDLAFSFTNSEVESEIVT